MENVFNQSIWGDEGFSAILSMKSIPDIIRIISRDTSPPLWNIIEHFAFKFVGNQETVIRGLSFIFFILTILFTYKIGSLLFSKKTGLLSAILLFLNPFFFTYAFEGRMYSILAFGVATSMYYYLRIFMGEGGKWTKIAYVFFTLWALYTHHFSIFALIFQGLWFVYEYIFGKRQTAKKVFKLFLFIAIGYLPWLIPLYKQTKMVGGGFWLGKPDTKDLAVLIFDYLADGIKNNLLVIPLINIPIYQVALIFTLTTLILKNWLETGKKTVFILLWFLFPILATWLLSQKFQSIFFNRYLLYAISPAMILLASARRGVASLITIVITIILFSIIDYQYFTHPTKLPFKIYSNYVKQNLKPGDYLINWNSKSHHLWETKYYGIPAPIYIPESGGELPFFVGTALMDKNDIIRKIPEGTKRVGAVTSGPIEEIYIPGYTESDSKEFSSLKIVWYEKSE